MSPPAASSPVQNSPSLTDTPDPASAAAAAAAAAAAHTRAYQACEGCRSRKVRCIMGNGNVDQPAGPPCNRCRREQKECVFSETRRKKRGPDGEGQEEWEQNYQAPFASPPIVNISAPKINPNKRVRRSFAVRDSSEGSGDGEMFDEKAVAQQLRASIGNIRSAANGARPLSYNSEPQSRSLRQHSADDEVAALQHPDIYSKDGMMGMLIRAAEQADTSAIPVPQIDSMIDPQMSSVTLPEPPAQQIAAWKRLKFVRSGWFKAKEGIAYVDYFYRNLLPHTPLALPDYNQPDLQVTLLEQEKLLLVSILCISSRYMKLSGQAATTRAAKIHDKLWTELHGMLGRLSFAQEQFGGGLCGAGAESKSVNQLAYRGMRTIGTIEALVLLVEWNPRALHFPPEGDDEDFMLPEVGYDNQTDEEDFSNMLVNGTGNEQKESWLEPLWRSDRMAWMQMSSAIALAMELGVFDDMSIHEFCENNPNIPKVKIQAFWTRKKYLRELLPVYFIQLAGRLEFTNKLPRGYIEALSSKTGAEERIKNLLAVFRGAASPGLIPGASPGTSYKDFSDPQQVLLYFWQEIAAIMKSVNQEIYRNGQMSAPLVKSGRYSDLIDLYHGPLERWRNDLNECCTETNIISSRMRHILDIEWEAARVHINAVAVQAVIERCINNIPHQQSSIHDGQSHPRKNRKRPPVPPSMLEKWSGDDRKYIKEVIAGGRNVLRIVIDDLLPGETLKHIPVRTYSRIMGVYIILLKAFFLYGSLEPEANDLFKLINRAFDAMGTCVVDDVHISNQFSAMGKSLLSRVTSRLIRISANGNTSSGAISPRFGRGRTPNISSLPIHTGLNIHNSHLAPPGNALQHLDNSLIMSQNDYSGQNAGILLPFTVDEYDPALHSVMPPPGMYPVHNGFEDYSTTNGDGTNGASSGQDDSGGGYMMDNMDQNWIMGELGDLFSLPQLDVSSTHFGPALNGMDLLDTLAPPVDGN